MAEYRNPNQQGGQDSSQLLIISVVLILTFLGLQYFRAKKPAAEPQARTQSQGQAASTAPGSTGAAAAGYAGTRKAESGAPQSGAQPAAVQAAGETQTVVENELYRIQFSNRGAQVTSWILKQYKDEAGRPLDLVHKQAAAQYGYPLSLFTYDDGLRQKLSQALYVSTAAGSISAPGTLGFTYSDGAVEVQKIFRFDASYVVHADVQVKVNGAPVQALVAWPSGFGDQVNPTQYASAQVDTMSNDKAGHLAIKKAIGGATLPGPFAWGGVSDLYFAAVLLPDAPQSSTMVSLHGEIRIPKDAAKPDPNQTEPAQVLGAALGDQGGHSQLRVYVGPKSLEVLTNIRATAADGSQTGPNLKPIVDFGFWKFISEPFFIALHWVYEHVVRNWGWSILVVTLFINLAMLPTRIKMMQSALKMQRIQPEMDQIKAKFAKYKFDDPRKADMNKEMFALQKREGVNMFGGCLPMLIQYPLLIGFYGMLSKVIELRQAHWFWIPDLASADPYHILPVFFVVSMFLSQWFTPSPGMDPAQQRMMAFTMPAVFGWITWHTPAALALYWACGNLIGVIQQLVMNRTSMGREMRAIAAKRALKRAGKQGILAKR